jgi:hypothetical protein
MVLLGLGFNITAKHLTLAVCWVVRYFVIVEIKYINVRRNTTVFSNC